MNNNSEAEGKNYHDDKKKSELIHCYSSVSTNKSPLNLPLIKGEMTAAVNLFYRLMFPLMISNKCKRNGKNAHYNKKYSQLIHFYSPLSKDNPARINTATERMPAANVSGLNFSGEITCPRTTRVKVTLAKSYKIFARLSQFFPVNLISLNFCIKERLCQA